jgi:hypothetical protein
MEIQDEIQIRIIQTLDLIARAEAALVRHRERHEIDTIAIDNYEELKARFTAELLELLHQVGVHLQLTAAA